MRQAEWYDERILTLGAEGPEGPDGPDDPQDAEDSDEDDWPVVGEADPYEADYLD